MSTTSEQRARSNIVPAASVAAWVILVTAAQSAVAQSYPFPAKQLEERDIHRVLVIPVNVRGLAPLAVDRKQITQALYGTDQSVASRYRVLSYGRVEFAGSDRDFVDPVTLPEPADFCNTGLGRLAGQALDEVRRRGIPLDAYNHFVFVLPKDAPCWWTGVRDIGGKRVWVKATAAKALAHELGHNLGMNHAVRWQNADAEGSDFMGSGTIGLNAPHVVQMGWLQAYPGKVVELTGAADVTLEPLETDPRRSALPKVAIVHPAPGANTYYLSYRASDTQGWLPGEFTRGLSVHIADAAQKGGGLTYFMTSLSDGGSYSDGPMIVRQLSHVENDRVTFRISFAGAGPARQAGPPSAPAGTLQSVASGKCLDLPQGRSADGTPAIQYDCLGGPNQQWTIVSAAGSGDRIVSRLSGKCLGTDPGHAALGAGIVQSTCDGSADQLWVREGDGYAFALRNVANHLCLDVPRASAANGAQPVDWNCNGGTNQTWRYVSPATP